MEISTRFHSSHVKPLFSDRSHLLLYGCSSSSHCKPIRAHLHTELTSSSPLASRRVEQPPLQSTCQPSSSTMVACNTCSELDLLKELAILKAQVKLKKKQLKAITKEKKSALQQRKAKAKCESSSSSSSSSEASDGGRMPMNMTLLKKDSSQNREEKGLKQGVTCGLLADVDYTDSRHVDCTDSQQNRSEGIMQCLPSRGILRGLPSSVEQACLQKCARPIDHMVQDLRDGTTAGPSHGALGAGRVRAISGSIEVCVGGKCKKAGSQQLLSSFKAQIPASACVDAIPCKCMGRCGAAINVKVHKEDTNPQHHSHVSVDDSGLILSHHFGLGPPLNGLQSLSLSSTPSIVTAQV